MTPCDHPDAGTIYMSAWSDYHFRVLKCPWCGAAYCNISDADDNHLVTAPCRVAHYFTGVPAAGLAYYWKFDGLNHSTGPIPGLVLPKEAA